jgi:hypothetical protein
VDDPIVRAMDDAVDEAVISPAEGDEYLSSLEARDRRGAVFFAALAISASAVLKLELLEADDFDCSH